MSFSKKDRNFRDRDGKAFPTASGDIGEATTFIDLVAAALVADFGNSPAKVKRLARLTGANERTVRNWLYARNGPNGEALVTLMRYSDAVLRVVLLAAGRDDLARMSEVAATRIQLREAMARLDGLLGETD